MNARVLADGMVVRNSLFVAFVLRVRRNLKKPRLDLELRDNHA